MSPDNRKVYIPVGSSRFLSVDNFTSPTFLDFGFLAATVFSVSSCRQQAIFWKRPGIQRFFFGTSIIHEARKIYIGAATLMDITLVDEVL